MLIKSVTPIESFIVKTNESYLNTYRRNSQESWEQLMGDSWETCYWNEQELEKLFQEFING